MIRIVDTCRDTIRVPQAAIRGANQLIFLDDEDRIRIREVRIMRSDADFAYLSSGASPGDRIVLTALENPINGTRVRTSITGAASGIGVSRADSEAPAE